MVWRGVIIEESLEDKSLLNLAEIVETKKSTLENEAEAGTLTFHKIEVSDAKKDSFLRAACKAVKDRFYLHICNGGVMFVVYKNKMFRFSKKDAAKINEARKYGMAHGILREQLEFEALVENPYA